MMKTHLIVPDFFDGADELRGAFEAHFRDPHKHDRTHQVWNYWYVPDSYTYLRASPTKIIPEGLLKRFVEHLNAWARAKLGVSLPYQPWISLYVNGCGQTMHNDSLNGQMGYVYSITKWSTRNFLGGETLLWRPESYWETARIKRPGAGIAFYEVIPSHFNQLLVFDDRVIHGVAPFQGTMDPLAGRVVLHGHFTAGELFTCGSLPLDAVQEALAGALGRVTHRAQWLASSCSGFMTLRVMIQPNGRVASVLTLCDRLLPLSPDKSALDPFREEVRRELTDVVFPPAEGPSEVTLPIRV